MNMFHFVANFSWLVVAAYSTTWWSTSLNSVPGHCKQHQYLLGAKEWQCGMHAKWLQVRGKGRKQATSKTAANWIFGLCPCMCTHMGVSVCTWVYLRRSLYLLSCPGVMVKKKATPHREIKNNLQFFHIRAETETSAQWQCGSSFLLTWKLPVNLHAVCVQAGAQLALHLLMLATHLHAHPPWPSGVKAVKFSLQAFYVWS